MRALNYRHLIPERGTVAVIGKEIWEPVVRAVAYAQSEGDKVYLVPVTPEQARLGISLGIEMKRGFPDYLFLLLDFERGEGLFTVGNCDCPMLMRLYEMGAEKTIVFLRKKYHTISVEYYSYLREEIEPIVSLYGEIVARRESPIGTTVVDVVPTEEDVEELRRLLKEVPGVLEVGIFPILPHRKIVFK